LGILAPPASVRGAHVDAVPQAAREEIMTSPMRPRISVIVPTYNRAHLIEKTLLSILNQTHKPNEIIVVDDCSSDQTAEVLAPHIQSGSVRYIRHERNKERAATRNTGMAAATGDLLTFLDSDDLMYPRCIEHAVQYAAHFPEFMVFQNQFEIVDGYGKAIYRVPLPNVGNARKAIAGGNFLACIGLFLRREIFTQYRFSEDRRLSGSEDWEFAIRVLADHPIGRIPAINCALVQHKDRSVNLQDLAEVKSRMKLLVSGLRRDSHICRQYGRLVNHIDASADLYLSATALGIGAVNESARFIRSAFAKDPLIVTNGTFWRCAGITTLQFCHGRQTNSP
jgi:glycosyltransferase involved in cell wall biosynthesis